MKYDVERMRGHFTLFRRWYAVPRQDGRYKTIEAARREACRRNKKEKEG